MAVETLTHDDGLGPVRVATTSDKVNEKNAANVLLDTLRYRPRWLRLPSGEIYLAFGPLEEADHFAAETTFTDEEDPL